MNLSSLALYPDYYTDLLDPSAIEFCTFGDFVYIYIRLLSYAVLYHDKIDVNKNTMKCTMRVLIRHSAI